MIQLFLNDPVDKVCSKCDKSVCQHRTWTTVRGFNVQETTVVNFFFYRIILYIKLPNHWETIDIKYSRHLQWYVGTCTEQRNKQNIETCLIKVCITLILTNLLFHRWLSQAVQSSTPNSTCWNICETNKLRVNKISSERWTRNVFEKVPLGNMSFG